jgi:hypothetical protein
MQGARIQGDIVSDYNQQDGMGLEIGGQLLGQGYRNLGGRLSVAWRY